MTHFRDDKIVIHPKDDGWDVDLIRRQPDGLYAEAYGLISRDEPISGLIQEKWDNNKEVPWRC